MPSHHSPPTAAARPPLSSSHAGLCLVLGHTTFGLLPHPLTRRGPRPEPHPHTALISAQLERIQEAPGHRGARGVLSLPRGAPRAGGARALRTAHLQLSQLSQRVTLSKSRNLLRPPCHSRTVTITNPTARDYCREETRHHVRAVAGTEGRSRRRRPSCCDHRDWHVVDAQPRLARQVNEHPILSPTIKDPDEKGDWLKVPGPMFH